MTALLYLVFCLEKHINDEDTFRSLARERLFSALFKFILCIHLILFFYFQEKKIAIKFGRTVVWGFLDKSIPASASVELYRN